MIRKIILLMLMLVVLFMGCSEDDGISSGSNPRFTETAWLYDDTVVRTVKITINPSYFTNVVWTQYTNVTGDKEYALAASISIDGAVVSNVGIRTRGNTSKDNHKRQFKISFDCVKAFTNAATDAFVEFPLNGDRRFRGSKKLNFRASQNDPTIIREKVASYIFQQAGSLASRVGFAKVYINEAYWGLYLTVEQIDKTFLDSRLSENDGNLYKAFYNPSAPFFQVGNEDSFDLKTNEVLNDKSGLTAFFSGLNSAADGSAVSSLVDIDNVINYLAAAVLVGHWDSNLGIGNNDYLYDHSDGKFRIVAWDLDNTFGSEWIVSVLDSSIYKMNNNANYTLLFDKIMADSSMKSKFENKLKSLLSSVYNTTDLYAKIDGWKSVIQDAVFLDDRKNVDWNVDVATGNMIWEQGFSQKPDSWGSSGFNHDNMGLKNWIAARYTNVQVELGLIPAPPVADNDGNASFATAEDLLLNTFISSSVENSVDKDYYKINIISSGWYSFSVTGIIADLELRMYNSSENFLADSLHSGSTPEVITVNLTNNGDYYLFVEGWSGATSSYSLLAVATNRPEIILDGSTNGDSYGAAILVNATNTNVKRVWAKRVGDDWYFAIEGTVATGSLLPDNGGIDIMVAIDDLDRVYGVTNLNNWWGLPALSFNGGESAEFYINLQAKDPKVSLDSSIAVKPNNFYSVDQANQGQGGYGLSLSHDTVYELRIPGLGSSMTNIKIAAFVWSAAGAWNETPPNMDGPIVESIPSRAGVNVLPAFVVVP